MLDWSQIRAEVTDVARHNRAELAVVFGSYARRTATEHSDLDLLFVEQTDVPFLRRVGKYFDPLFARLRTGLDVLVYTPAEFEAMRQRPFVERILKEGIVVHESGTVPR